MNARQPANTKRPAPPRSGVTPLVNPCLVVMAGGPVGRRYLLQDTTVIGRGPEADVCLDTPYVSRVHARIWRCRTSYHIEDIKSLNGTRVNDVPVDNTLLRSGDRISIGTDVVLSFTTYSPLAEQLRHRDRIEAVGRLTAGCVHDVNNMLTAVLSNVEHALGMEEAGVVVPEAMHDSLLEAREAVLQAAGLCGRLLSFSRKTRGDRALVDVSRQCASLALLMRRTMNRSIELHLDVEEGLVVDGDPLAVQQMLMNLCLNACDAMPKGGRLELRAFRLESGAVVLVVQDDGVGMDDETRERVFEPFFSTKRGAGSGLGLAIVKETVEALGGIIEVTSAPERGSTFMIELPPAMPVPEDLPTTVTRPPPAVPACSILVVDDEDLPRRAISKLLSSHGHHVLEAGSGQEVMRYAASPNRPDVVLLDLDMPGFGGLETLGRLRHIAPDVRVIIFSSRSAGAQRDDLIAAGAAGFLRKPCSEAELRQALAQVLRSRSDRTPTSTLPELAKLVDDQDES